MRTSTAVVRALGARETSLRPSVGRAIGVEQGVLLFKTEPGDLILGLLHDLGGMVTEVGPVGGAVVVVRFGKNKNVVTATEGILEDGGGTEVNIRVMTRSLVCGRAVKVPDAKLTNVGHLLADGLQQRRLDSGGGHAKGTYGSL